MSQTKAQLIDGQGEINLGGLDIDASAPDGSVNIDSSGRVGIGTTSPGEKLDVDGTVNATNLTRGGSQVYSRDNIVGTVSESSGTPTGAIIERGSNANGEFVKYADGTMVCTFKKSAGNTGTITTFGTFSFPATYASAPVLSFSCRSNESTAYVYFRTIPSTTQYFPKVNNSGTYTHFFMMAAGRWF
jgi:hypothetical protein